jgi:thioester reductase-like protein
VLPETDAAEHCAGHALGYSQTKWVAERLMTAAAERGLPVTIHRAPFITGDRGTGAWNSDDFICRLVRGIIALGAMPDLSASMDIVPVDYVARSIVQLSQRPESAGRRFHLCAVDAVPWSALADWLGELGHPVVRDPYAQWIARLPALRGTDHPLAPFVPLFLEKAGPDRPTVPEVFLQSAHSRLDGSATAALVQSLGIAPPVIDAPLWRRYLDKLRANGMLPGSSTPRPA